MDVTKKVFFLVGKCYSKKFLTVAQKRFTMNQFVKPMLSVHRG